MARGVLSGIALGAVLSLGVAVVLSVLVPMEPTQPPETGLAEGLAPTDTPAQAPAPKLTITGDVGGDVTQPQVSLRRPADNAPPSEPPAAAQAPTVGASLPQTTITVAPLEAPAAVSPATRDAPLAMDAPARPVESELPDEVPTAPARAPQPDTAEAADLSTPGPVPAKTDARAADDAPVLPNPQALAPMIPDDSPDTPVDTQTADAPDPEPRAEEIIVVAPAPQEPAPDTPEQTEAAAVEANEDEPTAEDGVAAARIAALPQVTQPPAEQAPASPRILTPPDRQGDADIATSRPRIGTPARTLIAPTAPDATEETNASGTPGVDSDLPPIKRFAADFDNPAAKPLMSIVLIDNGVDLDASEIGLPALSSFPYPVSFAVDANLADAPARMARYRTEGFEVLALVDLPAGARPTDAEVSLDVALSRMSRVVGVMDGTGEGLQGSREVADQVTQILRDSGHGLVAQSKGLDSMPKLAVKQGVPAAAVFRDFDSNDQNARVIRRFLDQAAFKAGQEGGVIVVGRLRPETVKALLVWGLADRASSVALAPVSAVLMSQL